MMERRRLHYVPVNRLHRWDLALESTDQSNRVGPFITGRANTIRLLLECTLRTKPPADRWFHAQCSVLVWGQQSATLTENSSSFRPWMNSFKVILASSTLSRIAGVVFTSDGMSILRPAPSPVDSPWKRLLGQSQILSMAQDTHMLYRLRSSLGSSTGSLKADLSMSSFSMIHLRYSTEPSRVIPLPSHSPPVLMFENIRNDLTRYPWMERQSMK
ncbi:hypothetical protein EDB80DRAFT_372002 [Ilyonectria destructans]|nr:hypothetical protein EDB80DRAFT_372002 [Ilyonectria destructans]